ncbi:sensor domain-containing protein [Pseudomonas schmalbachii]
MSEHTRHSPAHPATKGRLAHKSTIWVLILLVGGLLFWHLQDEFRTQERIERERTTLHARQLAQHLSLSLKLKAQAAQALVEQHDLHAAGMDGQPTDLRGSLQSIYPALHSLSRLDSNGQRLPDGDTAIRDQEFIDGMLRRTAGQPYRYAFSEDGGGLFYLLLHRPDGNGDVVLRLSGAAVRANWERTLSSGSTTNWLLEDRERNKVLTRASGAANAPLSAATPREQALGLTGLPIENSDWQLLPLFDNGRLYLAILPRLAGELLLYMLAGGIACVALFRLQRLRELSHSSSAEAQSRRLAEQARRRYRETFEDAGIALCVVDLADLRESLQEQGLHTADDLQPWLAAKAERQEWLLRKIRVVEINSVARQLLGVTSAEQAWQQLIGGPGMRPGGVRAKVIAAVLDGQGTVATETMIRTPQGERRHVWVQLRIPDSREELSSVTLSLSDITQRKQMELSLLERERFWSEVVQAVPDTLYIQDLVSQKVLFSNHSLGGKLGYSSAEIQQMGEQYWKKLIHPDEREYWWRLGNLRQVMGDNLLLESQTRWRHRDGSWRWLDFREQAFGRDADGRVARVLVTVKDITETVEGHESLHESNRRYRLLAESISDVIFSTDGRLNLNYISPSLQQNLGYSPEWALQHGFQHIVTNPEQLDRLYALLSQARATIGNPQLAAELRESGDPHLFHIDCLRADGRKVPLELRIALMWDELGRFEGLLGVARDISQQRRAEREMRMSATVFEHSSAAIMVTDPAGYIVQVNSSFTRLTGYSAGEVLDQQTRMLTADTQSGNQFQHILDSLQDSGTWEGEILLKRRGGGLYPSWVGITAVYDEEGDLVSFVCFFSDISERKASERRIHRLAYYDALTHLPNRTLFQDRLHTALQHAERHGQWVVLMFLDLDRFKPINDSLGHAAGDRMLKEVAERLSQCVSDDDTVARMGGDEFTLLLTGQGSREQALNRAIQVAEKILAGLTRPFALEGREFFVTASIGIALSPQDGAELNKLMKNADTAMYHAKEMGKNNYQFYQAEMNARALERLELESDLRRAIEQNEFVLHYQPQFTGDGRRLTGAEALLRWQHPRRGLITPSEFVPVLEELGLITQVGDWLLGEACRQLKVWHREKVRVPKISVNLSARQFADGQLGTRIARILEETGTPPACLELELTESILMSDVSQAMHTLSRLKHLGLAVAVDDFGTGYSSLNYLKQFPIDVLKIDRTFVDGLPHGEQDAQIARAIIAMAHSLSLMVIAEGVESQEQLDFLREHGCDEVQGFLFGRPMPAEQFATLFANHALLMLE